MGEAPCTKDLITITDKDFKVVNAVSIGAVFLIILFVFKSISLPVILVAVIEFAILSIWVFHATREHGCRLLHRLSSVPYSLVQRWIMPF